jgi:mono/diheme cytochrome c family protein
LATLVVRLTVPALCLVLIALPITADAAEVERGAYLFALAGCKACHTAGKEAPLLAGGPALKSPFGDFYAPNITPDETHGIGGWSDEDFRRAVKEGLSPEGSHYFPAFPYPSYSAMTDDDVQAIKDYIFSLDPVAKASRDHDVAWPFSWRWLQGFWKWLFFVPLELPKDPEKGEPLARGAYIVLALGHCSECHTPRNALGGPERDRLFSGTKEGPDGKSVPNITPDKETGIGDWSKGDLRYFLRTGILPDGDVAGGSMTEVVENATSKLTDEDLEAVITYLQSLPPLHNQDLKRKKKTVKEDDW